MEQARTPISFIATDRPDEARRFYADVMGLTLIEETQFALVFADGDHQLRIQIVSDFIPAPFTAHGWNVPDIASEVERLKRFDVDMLLFEQLSQDTRGVWTTPDGSKIAWLADPSGNILSFTQTSRD